MRQNCKDLGVVWQKLLDNLLFRWILILLDYYLVADRDYQRILIMYCIMYFLFCQGSAWCNKSCILSHQIHHDNYTLRLTSDEYHCLVTVPHIKSRTNSISRLSDMNMRVSQDLATQVGFNRLDKSGRIIFPISSLVVAPVQGIRRRCEWK